MKRFWLVLQVVAVGSAAAAAEPVDSFGGSTQVRLERTGRFRTEQWRGGRWLVTPEGHPVVLAALAHPQMPSTRLRVSGDTTATRFGDDPRRYGKDLVTWMRGAGLNTYSYGLPETVEREMNRFGELTLVPGFIPGPQFPDLFDNEFRAGAAAKVASLVPELAKDARVVGYILSAPLLFSPIMERPRIWRDGAVKRQNYLMAMKALPAEAAGKKAYVEYLRRTYEDYATYERRRGGWPGAIRFEDLLGRDLSERDHYETLHTDDAAFYQLMWSDVTAFLAREIRRHDPKGLILSYRFIRVQRWPDPWLQAALRGIGPHVDAFVPELYGDDPYREIVDGIGELTGKPSVIGDGMRIREFTYPDEADDAAEAASYRKMYLSLLASPWFLGGSICEYRDKKPNNAFYSPRPGEARTGVRRADYREREALRQAYEELHARKTGLRMELLVGR